MGHCHRQGPIGAPEGPTGLLKGLAEVLLGALRVGLHGGGTGRPVGGAHLPVLVGELERIHQPQGLAGKGARGPNNWGNPKGMGDGGRERGMWGGGGAQALLSVNAAAHGEIVDDQAAQLARAIDDEQATAMQGKEGTTPLVVDRANTLITGGFTTPKRGKESQQQGSVKDKGMSTKRGG